MLFAVFAVVSALTASQEWANFKKDFGKVYLNAAEENFRFKIFLQNLQLAAKAGAEDVTAEHGVTKFSDLTPEEFKRFYLMPDQPAANLARSCLQKGVIAPHLNAKAPDSFDWRDHTPAVVTPVKDQAQCGSCWAFSVTGGMEGAWALAGHDLVSLSEQQIVDCSHGCCEVPPYGPVCNEGCNGGWQWSAMFDIMTPQWGGLWSEKDYPYKGRDGTCQLDPKKVAASIANYTCLDDKEDHMKEWIATKGPLPIALDATPFQTYRNGILDPKSCQTKQLNHAVMIVGYGSEGGKDFWIIKNSWGTSWGEQGYVRLVRGKGACGCNNAVNAPLIHYP
jgi:cathepsin F